MKKLFTILAICFAATVVNAQNATIILEAGDVWSDGTGYQMLLDADAQEYANLPTRWPCGQSYSAYEYMIPTNATPADDNVVFNTQESITIPAGTYDYVILNPGCSSTTDPIIWIASANCDSAKYDNYVFEANKTYRFALTLNGQNDCVTLTITDGVGIANNVAEGIRIFPNPCNNVLNVTANGNNEVQIVNLLGQVITTQTMTDNAQINVSDLSNGVYFVRINGANGTTTQKFIKK